VVSIIHASYVPFMIMLIGGFIGARALLQRDRVELRRGAVLVGALTVPFALFMVWLYPIASHGGASLALETFATIMNVDGSLLSMKTEWVSRGGAAQIAALLLVPLAGAATRTRAGVFIASTTAIVILILIVPWFFTPFSAVMSVSQGRRLLFYLPWAFALAGGAMALARFGYIAVAGSLVAGVVLQILWPGDFAYTLLDPGPQGVAWFAGISAIVVLLVGLRRTLPVRYQERWAVPIVAVLLVPAAVVGLFEMRTVPLSDPIRTELLDLGLGIGPSLAKAVTRHVGRDDVLLAEPPVAFRLTAVSPVYIVAAQDAHGGDTAQNRHQERRLAVLGFYFRYTNDATRAAVLRDYDVDWVLTRQHRSYPRAFLSQFDVVYETKKFVLYRISDAASEGTPSSQG
jgi:hypothetical protein